MNKILVLIALSVLMAACNEKAAKSDAYGNFEATITTIGSEANGKLIFFKVEEGERLKAGELVAIIDTTQLHLNRKRIQASINTLPQKLVNTLAEIEVLKEQKANLVREKERVERLLAKKAATSKQLDDLAGQIDVVEKQMEAIRTQTSTGNRAILSEKEPLLAQKAVISEQIRKCYIYNPVGGQVLTKLSELHEVVGMGTPLYRIGKLDTMELRFYMDAVQLQEAKLRQPIQVLVDDGTEGYRELKGAISWIADEAEFTPKTIQTKEDRINLVYAAKAKVPNKDGLLKIGMPAEVNFSTKSQNQE